MHHEDLSLLKNGSIDLDTLHSLAEQPGPFTPGLAFWDDPHISSKMLETHLDPEIDAASRPSDVIDTSVEWLVEQLSIGEGTRILDLGCGPGLYAARLARHGAHVTGIDFSQRSIGHARKLAKKHQLTNVHFVYADFLTLDAVKEYDIVLQIFGEIATLSPSARDDLLERGRRALKPGGCFVFDVSTPHLRTQETIGTNWYIQPDGGFWKPGPHLVLEKSFSYPGNLHLDQFIVIEPDSTISVYRTWFLDYTVETITSVLNDAGFMVESLWGDLCGAPHTPDSDWIGIVARPAD